MGKESLPAGQAVRANRLPLCLPGLPVRNTNGSKQEGLGLEETASGPGPGWKEENCWALGVTEPLQMCVTMATRNRSSNHFLDAIFNGSAFDL